jgi:hypothetical protein
MTAFQSSGETSPQPSACATLYRELADRSFTMRDEAGVWEYSGVACLESGLLLTATFPGVSYCTTGWVCAGLPDALGYVLAAKFLQAVRYAVTGHAQYDENDALFAG